MDNKDKPTVLLEYYLKKLKLSTMLKEYALVAELCAQEGSDYARAVDPKNWTRC